MSENRNCNNTGFLVGLLAGSVIGATVAIMLAPDSGANTRTAIKGRANECKDRLSALASEYRQRIANLSDEYSSKLTELRAEMHECFQAQNAIDEEIAAAEECGCSEEECDETSHEEEQAEEEQEAQK